MKDSRWKQLTPTDQLTVLRMSLSGHFENWITGILDCERFEQRFQDHMRQIEDLETFLKGDEPWTAIQ